eukprot:6889322-Prymnesium_polylepis.2
MSFCLFRATRPSAGNRQAGIMDAEVQRQRQKETHARTARTARTNVYLAPGKYGVEEGGADVPIAQV